MLNIACYDDSDTLLNETTGDTWFGIRLTGSQYTVSEENWLTAIGCDDMVLGLGEGNVTFGGGCASFCNSDSNQVGFCSNSGNGNSPGYDCCRTSVPRGIEYLGAQFMNISKKWRKKKLFPCSYAFIEEKVVSDDSKFSYPLSYLNRRQQYRNYTWGPTTKIPACRLDWRIGAENCSVAQQNSNTYACQNNSKCVQVDAAANIQGYHCQCLPGYQGNPYLVPGCHDINECDDLVNPPCTSTSNCINNPGSFSCSCPEGYYGDGTATGFGCILVPRLPVVKSKNNIAIGLGSGTGCLLLLPIWFWLRKKFIARKERILREKFFKRNGGLLLQQKTNEGTIRKTKHFHAKELEKATDHYNESRILGQGGQGIVYKGMLSDGKLVAIKKLKQVDEDQLEQFINEVVILSQVDHRNVVKLLGCCLESEVPLLLYEYVPHGTLFNLIHDHDAQFPVSWNMRLKIAADIAGALAYLHFSTTIPIYHRDIKSSNILIGEKFIVKVSDFGTSKSVEVDKTHLTTLVKGTFGYLDPKYFRSGQLLIRVMFIALE